MLGGHPRVDDLAGDEQVVELFGLGFFFVENPSDVHAGTSEGHHLDLLIFGYYLQRFCWSPVAGVPMSFSRADKRMEGETTGILNLQGAWLGGLSQKLQLYKTGVSSVLRARSNSYTRCVL